MTSEPTHPFACNKKILYFMNNNTIVQRHGTVLRISFRLLVSWRLPMYSEAKLAFFIYLWYPQTKVHKSALIHHLFQYSVKFLIQIILKVSTFNIFRGRLMLYNVLFRPYAAKHEKEIDLNLLKLRIKAREIGLLLWEKAAIYGQTRFFEILQYVSSHSASLPQSDQVI